MTITVIEEFLMHHAGPFTGKSTERHHAQVFDLSQCFEIVLVGYIVG